jgi:hypothetical protein
MAMVNVREMRVTVRDRQMRVRMRMRFIAIVRKVVRVLMMFVMPMPVRMLEPLVRMFVFVPFAHMQPDAERHQRGRDPERDGR